MNPIAFSGELSYLVLPSDQTVNQSINETIKRAIDQSIKQSINQSKHHSMNQCINQSINQSMKSVLIVLGVLTDIDFVHEMFTKQ